MDLQSLKIGNNPPFLIDKNRSIIKTKNPLPSEPECSKFVITGVYLNSYEIKPTEFETVAYIKKRCTKIPIDVSGKHITFFSCFDEVFIYFLIKKSNDIYLIKFQPCRKFNEQTFEAEPIMASEDVLGVGNKLSIKCHIENLRRGYHYYTPANVATKDIDFSILLNGQKTNLHEIRCPLCFTEFDLLDELAIHVEILHLNYNATVDGRQVIINMRNLFFNPPSNMPFDFKMDESIVNDMPKHFIDFESDVLCSELAERFDNNTLTNISKIAVKDETVNIDADENNFINRINVFALQDKISLVKKIYELKGQHGQVKGLDFLYIKDSIIIKVDNTPKPASRKNLDDFRKYLTVINPIILDDVNRSKFIFFKKRTTALLSYKLLNYGLLIEKEFNTLDYSKVLADHLNVRLEYRSSILNKNEYKFMKRWNLILMKHSGVKESLESLLLEDGISNEILELIGILINKGVMSSEDIGQIYYKMLNK